MTVKSHNTEICKCASIIAIWFLLKLYVANPLLDYDLYKWEDLIDMIPILTGVFILNFIYWHGYRKLFFNICFNLINWFALVSLVDAFYCNWTYLNYPTQKLAEDVMNEGTLTLAMFHSIAVFAVLNILGCIAWHVWSRKNMG